MPIVYLALGSNLGDRREHLSRAVGALRARAGAQIVAVSSLYATAAVGIPDGPEFLNAAIGLRTPLAPEELLKICQAIERSEGRGGARSPAALAGQGAPSAPVDRSNAPAGRAPPRSRTLDLDLLLWGDEVRATPDLSVPHPRIHERAFVLAPLAEIAPDVVLRGKPVAAWAAAVGQAGVTKLAGSEDWARPGGG